MAFSRVPATIAALVAAFDAAADVLVTDGPALGVSQETDVVQVACETPDATAITAGTEAAMGLMQSLRETFTVPVTISIVREDIPSARTQAYALLEALNLALVADTTLGGVVMWARLAGRHELTQTLADTGAVVEILAGVDVDAFTGD